MATATTLRAQVISPAPIAGKALDSARATATGTSTQKRTVRAVRRRGLIVLDGHLDEPDWLSTPVAAAFIQQMPHDGAPASERTEVRILYDDDALYIGARMDDPHPDSLIAPVTRRDAMDTPTDGFTISIDSYRDRRTSFSFSVSPSNVQADGLFTNGGTAMDMAWDAVWESATSVDARGWTVELRIPLDQLRFRFRRTGATDSTDATMVWGLELSRYIARRGETSNWSPIPANAAEQLSHYGELTGMSLQHPPARLAVQPYVLSSGTMRSRALTNALVPAGAMQAQVGADLRYAITPDIGVNATVRPDFGQVEADPSVVNLTAFETLYPDLRPFFLEGEDIFGFPIGANLASGELFYTRRVGRPPQGSAPIDASVSSVPDATPILGAAKVAGKLPGGWAGGVFDAVTDRVGAAFMDGGGSRRIGTVEPLTNYAVLRTYRDIDQSAGSIGIVATATNRRLNPGDSLVSTLRTSAYSGGISARQYIGGTDYQIDGWLLGSDVFGTPAAITATQQSSAHYFQRPDASYLRYDTTRTSLSGGAAHAAFQKIGGTWRWGLNTLAYWPGFEANDLGYMPQADLAEESAQFGYTQNSATRLARQWSMTAAQWMGWDFGGERVLTREHLTGNATLNNFWAVNGMLMLDQRGLSLSALRGGPALVSPARVTTSLEVTTDTRRPASLDIMANTYSEPDGGSHFFELMPTLSLRPSSRAQLAIGPDVQWANNAWQYVATVADSGGTPAITSFGATYVLGTIKETTLGVMMRLAYALTPTLSLQLYAQPFAGVGTFDRYEEVVQPRAATFWQRVRAIPSNDVHTDSTGQQVVVRSISGTTYAFARPDFVVRDLHVNAVLRWQYRPGSTLFVVWTHSRDESDVIRQTLGPAVQGLWRVPAINEVIIKASYRIAM